MLGDNKNHWLGFLGLLGIIGMQGFTLHNPWYLLGYCFSGFFFYFRFAPGKLSYFKYLGLLSVAGLSAPVLNCRKTPE